MVSPLDQDSLCLNRTIPRASQVAERVVAAIAATEILVARARVIVKDVNIEVDVIGEDPIILLSNVLSLVARTRVLDNAPDAFDVRVNIVAGAADPALEVGVELLRHVVDELAVLEADHLGGVGGAGLHLVDHAEHSRAQEDVGRHDGGHVGDRHV